MTNAFVATEVLLDGRDFKSSAVDVLAYNADKKEAYIEFKASSTGYVYENVAESTFRVWADADSVGRFYTDYFSPRNESVRRAQGAWSPASARPNAIAEAAKKREATKPAHRVNGKFAPAPTASRQVPAAPKVNAFAPAPVAKAVSLGRYSVAWETKDGKIGGKPEYQARSIDDALRQFNEAIEAAATLVLDYKDAKVKSVTVYFD